MGYSRKLLPSIASLCAIEAIDRHGSASSAADELALTQGAVSRQLQALEQQLGITLVERHHKSLALTRDGRRYVQRVRHALDTISQATLDLQSSAIEGTLNLAILPAFGMRWLMPRLPDFTRRHPDITLNMGTRLAPFNFATEAFDAAVHFGNANWPGTEALLLRYEAVLPVCAPELLQKHKPDGPEDLASLPLMHIQTRPKAWSSWFELHGVGSRVNQDGATFDQFSTILQAALHGLGVALLPTYLIEQELSQGRLVALDTEPRDVGGAYYLVWPKGRETSKGLREFIDWISTQAEPEERLPR